jgi:hypothetical protein
MVCDRMDIEGIFGTDRFYSHDQVALHAVSCSDVSTGNEQESGLKSRDRSSSYIRSRIGRTSFAELLSICSWDKLV